MVCLSVASFAQVAFSRGFPRGLTSVLTGSICCDAGDAAAEEATDTAFRSSEALRLLDEFGFLARPWLRLGWRQLQQADEVLDLMCTPSI